MFLFDLAASGRFAESDIPIDRLWTFLPIGYLLTILVETPILVVGLSRKITLIQKLLCGVWLTACTYPIVILVMPMLFQDWHRWQYLTVAEVFAPMAECALFWLAFRGRHILMNRDWAQCFVAITIANMASFGMGEVLNYFDWFGLF
jgi:hypothetical protein